MADEKQQASASERDALEPTTSSQETAPAATRDAPEPATSRTQETKEQQAPASEWDALEPTTSHGGTHLNPPCNQSEPPEASQAHSPPQRAQGRRPRVRSRNPKRKRVRGRSFIRSRSPLEYNETLLARAFAQPDPNEHDLTEGVEPEELRRIAQLLTRTARKLEAAARNNARGAMQCLAAASGDAASNADEWPTEKSRHQRRAARRQHQPRAQPSP